MLKYPGLFFSLVRFEHTVFALPFAYMGMLMAAGGLPTLHQFLWVTGAMVGARTAGMALNRLIDLDIDRKNPRTSDRVLPRGLLSKNAVILIIVSSISLLLLSAYRLNPLCFYLSPAALVLLFTYSYLKRFTWVSHFVLGMILGCAPVGGWIAVTGKLAEVPILVGLAVLFWVAGFDVLYACQDVFFDKKEGLYSIPQTFGVQKSLNAARILHVVTFGILLVSGFLLKIGYFYFIGLAIVGGLLFYEHTIISTDDQSRIETASFVVNAAVSISLLVFTFLGVVVR